MLKRLFLAAAMVLAGALAAAGDERAGEAGPTGIRLGLGGAVNPAGAQAAFDATAWHRGLSRSRGALLRDAHVSAGLSGRLTPAYGRLGPWAELAPLSVLDVRAGVEAVGYFGTFHSVLFYRGYGEPFDDDSRRSRGDARSGLAAVAYIAPTVKARVGPVVFRSRAQLEWWSMPQEQGFFYEPSRDTLLRATGDALVATETILLWSVAEEERRRLRVGPIHEMTLVLDYPRNRRQLVGVAAVFETGGRLFGLAQPALLVKVARYVEEPNRQGGITLQAGVSAAVRSR